MSDTRPYWFPVLCDAAYFERLRKDYPENAKMSDEELHEYYNNGLKYQNLWDHVGDAYSDYEPLADHYLELLAMLEHAVHWHDQLTKDDIARYQAVISKAKGE